MLTTQKLFCVLVLCHCLSILTGKCADEITAGPGYHQFRLTLEPGERTEAFGPFFYSEEREAFHQWAIPPLFSSTKDEQTGFVEVDVLYPILTYDRFGAESRFQILQWLSFSSGQDQSTTNAHRFTLFPLYFQQRSEDPDKNYTALLPFYGHLQNRFFRDDLRFFMLPLYVQTRKKDVVTDNYLLPIFHLRHGENLEGWQVWPLAGHEHKDVSNKTNGWGETEIIGGHDKVFWLWPLFLNHKTGIGTDNPQWQQASGQRCVVQWWTARTVSGVHWPCWQPSLYGKTHQAVGCNTMMVCSSRV